MKVALCISGSLRNFKDTFYSFKEFILDIFDVDTFIYSPENKEGHLQNFQDVNKLFKPKHAVITETNHYNSLTCKYSAPNIYYMAYNVLMCNNLKEEYEQKNNFNYDLVIRARPDFFWFRSFTKNEINLAKTNILIPKEWSFKVHSDLARCDMLAVGNNKHMNVYSSLYNYIDNYGEKTTVHPETLCGYHLYVNNIPNIEIDRPIVFEYPTLRGEKYIHPYKFTKYFTEPDIADENQFLYEITNKRKTF